MIVGLAGFAGVGKDFVADYLVEEHGFTKRAFAETIREGLLAVNPMIDVEGHQVSLSHAVEFFSWDELKEQSAQIRPLLQRFGTEFGRTMLGQDVWVDAAMAHIIPTDRIVFSDVRFPNECQAIRNFGGVVWRIHRPGVGPINKHISEVALEEMDFDDELNNDETLEWQINHAIRQTSPLRLVK